MESVKGVIFLVTDDDTDREVCANWLAQSGYTVVFGQSVALLDARLSSPPVDLILFGIALAQRDDFAGLRSIKVQSTLRQTPLIVIAPAHDLQNIVECIRRGADDYLATPIEVELLRARVGAWLKRKQPRDQERFGAVKGDFTTLVAHELKAPLTSIRGYADLLLQGMAGPVNETQIEFLQAIRTNVDRMMVLVSDLNDVARIEAGHLSLHLDAIDVAEVIDKVIQWASQELHAKNQTLALKVASGLPKVRADRARLTQILTNLVSNAYKYTAAAGVITISAGLVRAGDTGEGTAVQVTVRDSGFGIRPEDQALIFQKFFRSEDEQLRDTLGAGLGLNITKHLVELQGGRIWFESVYCSGSAFHFTIPVAEG